ncbi:MAG: site-specific DNA-methyltransferase [Verrucomicrobiota bacterium]
MDTVVERLPLASADPLADRLARLRELFPEAAGEAKVDLEKLRALLDGGAASGVERYGLSWAGKSDALKAIQKLTTATLLPSPAESVNWDTTGNAIIEGDNLEVLKVLQHAYYGKVKLIYIDPPYNTGGDFIYPDNYAEGLGSYLTYLGQVKDGVKQTTNLDTSGRFHSRWLTMMYPRLFLARNLLREDGVIFVSIDDHEVSNLRMVMDEIFGEENFVGQLIWKRRQTVDSRAQNGVSTDHEYVLCYSRGTTRLRGQTIDFSKFKNPDNDSRGEWWSADLTGLATREERPNLHYDLENPETGSVYACPENGWRYGRETMARMVAEKRIVWPSKTDGRPRLKRFKNDRNDDFTNLCSILDTVFTTQGTRSLKELFDGRDILDFPKPVELIKLLAYQATQGDDLILDFFAGSGTTGQAVLELNKEDGGNRRFVLVQLPEPTGREDFPTIAEITKERVRRVIRKMTPAKPQSREEETPELDLRASAPLREIPQDLGFKVFKLGESNFAVWDPELAATEPGALAKQWQLSADNVRADATETALLCELMLKSGLPLHAPATVRDAGGAPVYLLDEGRVLFCLARELTRDQLRTMAEWKPQSVLCLDVAFKGNDALKVNAQLEFQSHGIQFRTA